MRHLVEPHSCRDEMWRIHPPAYGKIRGCSCGRTYTHQPLTVWRVLAVWRKTIPALGGDLWVAIRDQTARRGPNPCRSVTEED